MAAGNESKVPAPGNVMVDGNNVEIKKGSGKYEQNKSYDRWLFNGDLTEARAAKVRNQFGA
ncbi:hypothetical protein GCM10023166_22030 [Paeniglutamicibacter cryotolerans]